MLGGEVVERQQHVEVLADLGDRLGPLGAVAGLERLRRGDRVLFVLGVVDLGERLPGAWMDIILLQLTFENVLLCAFGHFQSLSATFGTSKVIGVFPDETH